MGKEVISSSSGIRGVEGRMRGDVPAVEYSYSEGKSDWEVRREWFPVD